MWPFKKKEIVAEPEVRLIVKMKDGSTIQGILTQSTADNVSNNIFHYHWFTFSSRSGESRTIWTTDIKSIVVKPLESLEE